MISSTDPPCATKDTVFALMTDDISSVERLHIRDVAGGESPTPRSWDPTGETGHPRTTILVVTYRQARWVEQCLQSCLVQTVPVRLVVIDDASDDGSADVVRRWADETDTDLQLIAHETNVGLGPSLAEGLSLVRTDFFAYLAGDDWMEPDRVEQQAAAFDRAGDPCVLVYSDCYRADADGHRFDALFSEGLGSDWRPHLHHAFEALIADNWIPAPTVMIRTVALRQAGGYDPRLFYEDHDAYLRLSKVGEFRCIDRPLATHRELTTSLGHRMFFYPDTADEWSRAKILIYSKHLGSSAGLDAAIAQRIAIWTVRIYKKGSATPTEVAHWLQEAVPYLATGRARFRLYERLARLGVPGRWLARPGRRSG